MLSQAAMATAAPVGPMVNFVVVARDITVQMNKFDCEQLATRWNKELAKLVTFRAKTNWSRVKLGP